MPCVYSLPKCQRSTEYGIYGHFFTKDHLPRDIPAPNSTPFLDSKKTLSISRVVTVVARQSLGKNCLDWSTGKVLSRKRTYWGIVNWYSLPIQVIISPSKFCITKVCQVILGQKAKNWRSNILKNEGLSVWSAVYKWAKFWKLCFNDFHIFR